MHLRMCISLSEATIIAIVVVGSLGHDGSQFTIVHFPPVLCTSDGDSFYDGILFTSIFTAIIMSTLVIIRWAIHKVRWFIRH